MPEESKTKLLLHFLGLGLRVRSIQQRCRGQFKRLKGDNTKCALTKLSIFYSSQTINNVGNSKRKTITTAALATTAT